jgi:hypothetical protein
MEGLKLGKKPATQDDRDITFSVVRIGLPEIKVPSRFGHGTIFPNETWRMLGNGPDPTVHPGFGGAGDCVEAMMGHVTMEAAKLFRRQIPALAGKEAIAAYSAITGYVLDDESTDNGTDMRDAMRTCSLPSPSASNSRSSRGASSTTGKTGMCPLSESRLSTADTASRCSAARHWALPEPCLGPNALV